MARTQTERKNNYNSRKYERIVLVVKTGDKDKLKWAADEAGVSINKFVMDSINAQHPGLLIPLDDESRKKKDREAMGIMEALSDAYKLGRGRLEDLEEIEQRYAKETMGTDAE